MLISNNSSRIDVFINLIKDQFSYGGQKYQYNEKKEVTDILVDTYSHLWLLGTLDKYTYRYRNLGREKDLLKIACYQYILWLKRGFYINETGIEKPILYTTSKLKEDNLNCFANKLIDHISSFEKMIVNNVIKEEINNEPIIHVSDILEHLSKKEWKDIDSWSIFRILHLIFIEWSTKFSGKENHDTDTIKTILN